MSLFDVQVMTGILMEDLDQLEQDSAKKRPSPKILETLAFIYEIDWEILLMKAGHFVRKRKPVSSLATKIAARVKFYEADWLNAELRNVLVCAYEHARIRGTGQRNTTDLLYGLFLTPGILKRLGIERKKVRLSFQLCTDFSDSADEKCTFGYKMALSQGFKEAVLSKQNFVHAEHLVIGLLIEEKTDAARTLRNAGLSIEKVRESIKRTSSK